MNICQFPIPPSFIKCNSIFTLLWTKDPKDTALSSLASLLPHWRLPHFRASSRVPSCPTALELSSSCRVMSCPQPSSSPRHVVFPHTHPRSRLSSLVRFLCSCRVWRFFFFCRNLGCNFKSCLFFSYIGNLRLRFHNVSLICGIFEFWFTWYAGLYSLTIEFLNFVCLSLGIV